MAQHFTPVPLTGKYCPIVIQNAVISGAKIFPGDEIAVFDDTLCVGAASFNGTFPVSFSASMKIHLPDLSVLPGATQNDSMIFKIWQVSSNNELKAVPNYITGGTFIEGIPTVVSLLDAFELLPPIADVNGPYIENEATSVLFDASASSDPDGVIVMYEWDWDMDGLYDDTTSTDTISYTWFDDYVGLVIMRVTDNDGITDTDQASVRITNVAPLVYAGDDQTILQSDTVFLAPATFTDPGGNNDTYSSTINWGDGTTEPGILKPPSSDGEISGSHIYSLPGTYLVIVTVSDEDNGTGKDSLSVTVEYAKPSINIPNLTITEDETLYVSLLDLGFFIVDNHFMLSDLNITFSGDTTHYGWYLDLEKGLSLWSKPENWNGNFEIILSVKNPLNFSDSDTSSITVNPVNDEPKPFDLVSPPDSILIANVLSLKNNIRFTWSKSINVDTKNGDYISYEFYLGMSPNITENRLIQTTEDTFFVFENADQMGGEQYYWSVKARDSKNTVVWANQTWSLSNIESNIEHYKNNVPSKFSLHQNYPNPFNGETQIRYEVSKSDFITLKVYNSSGQLIRTIVNGKEKQGIYDITWNGMDEKGQIVSSGIYIYILQYGNVRLHQKMMYLK
jgi:hypothetical protein